MEFQLFNLKVSFSRRKYSEADVKKVLKRNQRRQMQLKLRAKQSQFIRMI